MGIRFTASSAAILLCSADCALSADSRAFSAAVVASLAALPAALSAVFFDNSAS
ncbi:phage domain protein, partial [Escherichia coli TW09195]